jgi:excisionase family DNA binding protein
MTERATYHEATDLLTLAEAADQLRVSRRTLERYMTEGSLPVVRLPSGHRRIRRADLEAMIDGGAA